MEEVKIYLLVVVYLSKLNGTLVTSNPLKYDLFVSYVF